MCLWATVGRRSPGLLPASSERDWKGRSRCMAKNRERGRWFPYCCVILFVSHCAKYAVNELPTAAKTIYLLVLCNEGQCCSSFPSTHVPAHTYMYREFPHTTKSRDKRRLLVHTFGRLMCRILSVQGQMRRKLQSSARKCFLLHSHLTQECCYHHQVAWDFLY